MFCTHCVLPWTLVSPNLSKNQLGRVGFHSEICESSLPVFQGWIALGRMEPIVGCWVHPTSTTQTLTQWTSTWHHMWVKQSQEKSWHGIQKITWKQIVRTTWPPSSTRRMTSVWSNRTLWSRHPTRYLDNRAYFFYIYNWRVFIVQLFFLPFFRFFWKWIQLESVALTSITGPTEQLGISLSSTKTVNCLQKLKLNIQPSYLNLQSSQKEPKPIMSLRKASS